VWVPSTLGGSYGAPSGHRYGPRYVDPMSDISPPSPAALSADVRAQLLNSVIAAQAQAGWTVQTMSEGQAILSRNKRIGWALNLLLAFLTFGIWLIVVLVQIVNRKKETLIVTVDKFGNVQVL
jgi:hypothetical protein